MAKRVLLGSVLGGVVIFFWGFLYWAMLSVVISPWHSIPEKGDPNVVATLDKAFPESGVYQYPWVDTSKGDQPNLEKDFERQRQEGPFIQVFFHKGKPNPMGQTMATGFVHMWISALICSALLWAAQPFCCYSARVAFVTGLGFFATVWIQFGNTIWWHYPTSNAFFFSAYDLGAWVLAGLVIGAVVKESPESQQAK